MKNISVHTNLSKDNDLSKTRFLATRIKEFGMNPFFDSILSKRLGYGYNPFSINMDEIDIALVLGGDGTLLSTAREFAHCSVPFLGVNIGHLGFLTEIELNDIDEALVKISEDDYLIEKRLMLKAEILNGGLVLDDFIGLNDIGIAKSSFSRMVKMSVFIDECLVGIYSADGIIVSSPTGSTAYSLSAGGPIVKPDMNALIITPICAHSLNSRSIVISDSEKITITFFKEYDNLVLTIDGQQGYKLSADNSVQVYRAKYDCLLVKLKDKCFYEILRSKLSNA